MVFIAKKFVTNFVYKMRIPLYFVNNDIIVTIILKFIFAKFVILNFFRCHHGKILLVFRRNFLLESLIKAPKAYFTA